MKLLLQLFILLAFFSSCKENPQEQSPYTFIQGGTIIDPGAPDKDIVEGYILIKDNSIVSLGPRSQAPEIPQGATVVDASGKYIIPGLIDGFAVMNNQFYANAYLSCGVTTILGVDGGRRGWFYPTPDPGPDFYMLESVGDEIASDSVHLSQLRSLHKKNYKIALLKYKLQPQQVKLLQDEAEKLGMGTIGELGYTSYKKGIDIGVNAFVHTTRYSLDMAPSAMQQAVADHPFSNDMNSAKWQYYRFLYQLDSMDSRLANHARNLASGNTFLMPTMSLLYGDLPGMSNPWGDPVAEIINPSDINSPLDRTTGKHTYSEEVQENYTAMGIQELMMESTYQSAGAKYLAGSGTDVWGTMPGISLHTELKLLHSIGLSKRQTLASATNNFSQAFGWNTGKIAPGFEADLVILNNNPLEDLKNLRDIHTLICNGETIDLEKLLEIKTAEGLADGSMISRKPLDPLNDPEVQKLLNRYDSLGESYEYLSTVQSEELLYSSDGFRVKAYVAYPKKEGTFPVIIYNRGGNREFSKISPKRVVDVLARMASWGYVVIGSQYRGVDGGDGQEEFGGADVNDVLNLIPLLESILQADTDNIGMYGRSRGGMMTYLALGQTDRIKACAVVGGAVNLQQVNDSRNGIMEQYVYSQLIPGYWENKDSLLRARSALFQAHKLPKNAPILIMHGTADWRVIPQESYDMAQACQDNAIPYRLVMFEGGDHSLSEHKKESNDLIRSWFDRYLKEQKELPDLNPHGR